MFETNRTASTDNTDYILVAATVLSRKIFMHGCREKPAPTTICRAGGGRVHRGEGWLRCRQDLGISSIVVCCDPVYG